MRNVSWSDVPLFWLDSARALDDEERLRALDEYRRTGGIAGVVMAEPSDNVSAEACERLIEAGPDLHEIDWSGFEAAQPYACECGQWSGYACACVCARRDVVVVEFVPDDLRASHEAAGNRGSFPHNGALRVAVTPECAEHIVAEDSEWARVVP